jgi:hypothetical protein
LLNEVKEQCANVLEYQESIEFLRHNKEGYEDIKVHEQLVEEINSRPLSWISREEIMPAS